MKCKIFSVTVASILLSGCVSSVNPIKNDTPLIERSPYFTGQNDSLRTHHVSLANWLKKDKESAGLLKGDEYLTDNTDVVGPLYTILNRIQAAWPGKTPDVSIFVAVHSSRNVYGAKAFINNEIVINYKTILGVESDDELAAIIAHEYAHILLEHNKEIDYFNKADELFNSYRSAKVFREFLQASSLDKVGEGKYNVNIDPSVYAGIMQANRYKEQAGSFYDAFHGTAFSRGAEIEADLLAADLLVNAGYSPRGLQHSLERLTSAYETESLIQAALEDVSSEIMDAALNRFQEQLVSLQSNGQIPDASQMMSGLKDQLLDGATDAIKETAFKMLKNSHPVPDERMEELAEYLDEKYTRKQRNRRPEKSLLAFYKKSGGFSILENYELAENSLNLALLNEVKGAEDLRRRSLRGKTSKDAFTRYRAYEVRLAQGNTSKAIQNLKLIGSFANLPLRDSVRASEALVEAGQYDSAKKVVQEKEQFLGTVPAFYPTKIKMALAQKQGDKVLKLATECIENKDSSTDISKFCSQSAGLEGEVKPKGGLLDGLKSFANQLSDATS